MSDDALISEWLTWLEHNKGRAVGTVGKYEGYLSRLAGYLAGKDSELLEASNGQLLDFCGAHAFALGMQPLARRPLVAAVKGFYRWALGQWYIDKDPAESIPYPSAGRRLPKCMALSNAGLLMKVPDMDSFIGVRDVAILAVFLGCGLRLSGLVALNQSSLVFHREDGRECLSLRVVEKGDNERWVPAPDEAMLLVRAYLGHPELRVINRTLGDGDQVLFVSVRNRLVPDHEYYGENRRLAKRSVADMLERYGQQAGIPRDQCRPHALRHLYATELVENDVQMLKIQTLMGHSDPKSTAIYNHVALRSLRRAVVKGNPLSKIQTPVSGLDLAILGK